MTSSTSDSSGASAAPQSEALYVTWMRGQQLARRRASSWLRQRQARPDVDHVEPVDFQTLAWAERHAHERRLHDSAIAQMRHD